MKITTQKTRAEVAKQTVAGRFDRKDLEAGQMAISPDLALGASGGLEAEKGRGSVMQGEQNPFCRLLGDGRMSGSPGPLAPVLNSSDRCFCLWLPTTHAQEFKPM